MNDITQFNIITLNKLVKLISPLDKIYAQKNISPAPAAIIYSLEGVFATIAGWILLSQILGINNILGCFFILLGVILSQMLPIYENRKLKI